MSVAAAPCTLGMVLMELGRTARLVSGDESSLGRTISHADMWFAGDPVPDVPGALIVCPHLDLFDAAGIQPLMDGPSSQMLAIHVIDDPALLQRFPQLHDHIVVGLSPGVNLADVVAVVARATRPSEEQVSRRLSVLQRSLSRALADASPMTALLSLLKRTCNATVALVELDGHVAHATGPLPLGLLHDQLNRAAGPSVVLDVDGWHGVAHLVEDNLDDDKPFGWLVVAARRSPFPDPFVRAAVEVAATLVETAHRIAVAERTQERAVRASVLEQLLALQVERDDPELSGRVAGLGIRFDDELRVLIVKPVGVARVDGRRSSIADLGAALAQIFRTASVGEFLAVRDDHITVLVQCSPATARRLLVANDASHELQVGAGRRVITVGDVVDSYNDAHLAVRALQRYPGRSGFVAFEDFDFATRLFSTVGLDRMGAWAREFFMPLEGRHALIAAVQSYFARGQNVKAAANDLFVHHNSLRYRLAKVEELLGISFSDPAAIASTYLALTALDLVNDETPSPRIAAAHRAGAVHAVDSIDAATEPRRQNSAELGVAFGPER